MPPSLSFGISDAYRFFAQSQREQAISAFSPPPKNTFGERPGEGSDFIESTAQLSDQPSGYPCASDTLSPPSSQTLSKTRPRRPPRSAYANNSHSGYSRPGRP